jgi:P27 family predicted phage terminase small subunit
MPRRSSVAEKKLRGTTRSDRTADQAKADGQLGGPPEHLTEAQAEMWRWAIQNAPRGVLHAIDEATLEDWCCSRVVLREAYAIVEREGQIIRTPNGCAQKHPALATMVQASKIMNTAAQRLGFDPSSRAKIAVEPELTDEEKASQEWWRKFSDDYKPGQVRNSRK